MFVDLSNVVSVSRARGGEFLPYLINFATLPDGALPNPWTGATWSISGGRLINTPTLNGELLTDGALENWISATNLEAEQMRNRLAELTALIARLV